LAMYDTLTNRNQVNYEPLSDVQIRDIQQQVRKFIDNDISDIDVVNLRQIQEIFTQFKYFVENVEKEGEKRLKEKYALIEKGETNENGAENSLPVERLGMVGENDGATFSVGRVNNANAKAANVSPVVTARKRNKKGKDSVEQDRKPSVGTGAQLTASLHGNDPTKISTEEPSSMLLTNNNVDNTPPSREDGFVMFKAEQGLSLNKIFAENKEILHDKKSQAKQLSESINHTKLDIDQTKIKLEAVYESKEYLHEKSTTGEVIVDEEEFDLLRTLKSLKNEYRDNYEQLQRLRADISYCEDLVKQCRRKLLAEFERWYLDSFPSIKEQQQKDATMDCVDTSKHISALGAAPVGSFPRYEDSGEKFDKIQKQALMKDPESMAFYNARLQTERRKLYGGTASASAKEKQRPGSVTSSVRNAPPKSMLVN